MQEKLKLLFIGSAFSALVAVLSSLVTSHFSGYALKAETQKDKTELEIKIKDEIGKKEVQIAYLQSDLKHLKDGQKELKQLIKEALKNR